MVHGEAPQPAGVLVGTDYEGLVSQTAVEAASWAVATSAARQLGAGWTISQLQPGGGTYDLLRVHRRREGPLDAFHIDFNRHGSVHVSTESGSTAVAGGEVWGDLAMQVLGIEAFAAGILAPFEHLRQNLGQRPGPEVLAWRVVSEILSRAALFQIGWRAVQVFEWEEEGLRPLANAFPDLPALRTPGATGLRDLWFVQGGDGSPIACVDTSGRIFRAFSPEVIEFADYAEDLSLAHALSSEVLADPLRRALASQDQAPPVRPGLGLPAALSAFNRKERFFVAAHVAGLLEQSELHGPGLPLAEGFRQNLSASLHTTVPAHAFAVTDYHLSWLHAAIAWWCGRTWPLQRDGLLPINDDDGQRLVDGSQEDADLLVAWSDGPTSARVVAVEAKAYGSWSNAQMASKVQRLDAIRRAAEGSGVEISLVLTSRRRERGLNAPEALGHVWPDWATDDEGRLPWIPLSAPGLRLATERCGSDGTASATGEKWRITGPSGA